MRAVLKASTALSAKILICGFDLFVPVIETSTYEMITFSPERKPFRAKSLEECSQVSISEISGRTSRDAEKADQKINTEAED